MNYFSKIDFKNINRKSKIKKLLKYAKQLDYSIYRYYENNENRYFIVRKNEHGELQYLSLEPEHLGVDPKFLHLIKLYRQFGVKDFASDAEIKKQRKKLMLLYHEDIARYNGISDEEAKEESQIIIETYKELMSDELRAMRDEYLKTGKEPITMIGAVEYWKPFSACSLEELEYLKGNFSRISGKKGGYTLFVNSVSESQLYNLLKDIYREAKRNGTIKAKKKMAKAQKEASRQAQYEQEAKQRPGRRAKAKMPKVGPVRKTIAALATIAIIATSAITGVFSNITKSIKNIISPKPDTSYSYNTNNNDNNSSNTTEFVVEEPTTEESKTIVEEQSTIEESETMVEEKPIENNEEQEPTIQETITHSKDNDENTHTYHYEEQEDPTIVECRNYLKQIQQYTKSGILTQKMSRVGECYIANNKIDAKGASLYKDKYSVMDKYARSYSVRTNEQLYITGLYVKDKEGNLINCGQYVDSKGNIIVSYGELAKLWNTLGYDVVCRISTARAGNDVSKSLGFINYSNIQANMRNNNTNVNTTVRTRRVIHNH